MERNHTTHIHIHIPAPIIISTIMSMGDGTGDSVVSGGDCVGGGPATARMEHIIMILKLNLTLGLLVGNSN